MNNSTPSPFPTRRQWRAAVAAKLNLNRYFRFYQLTGGQHKDAVTLAASKMHITFYESEAQLGIKHEVLMGLIDRHAPSPRVLACLRIGITLVEIDEIESAGQGLVGYLMMLGQGLTHQDIMFLGKHAPAVLTSTSTAGTYVELCKAGISINDACRFIEIWGKNRSKFKARRDQELLEAGLTYAEIDELLTEYGTAKFEKYVTVFLLAHAASLELSRDEITEIASAFQYPQQYFEARRCNPQITHGDLMAAVRKGVSAVRYARRRKTGSHDEVLLQAEEDRRASVAWRRNN